MYHLYAVYMWNLIVNNCFYTSGLSVIRVRVSYPAVPHVGIVCKNVWNANFTCVLNLTCQILQNSVQDGNSRAGLFVVRV